MKVFIICKIWFAGLLACLHSLHMGVFSRYIEVFKSSAEEMARAMGMGSAGVDDRRGPGGPMRGGAGDDYYRDFGGPRSRPSPYDRPMGGAQGRGLRGDAYGYGPSSYQAPPYNYSGFDGYGDYGRPGYGKGFGWLLRFCTLLLLLRVCCVVFPKGGLSVR